MTAMRGFLTLAIAVLATCASIDARTQPAGTAATGGPAESLAAPRGVPQEKNYNVGGALTLVGPISYTIDNTAGTLEMTAARIQNDSFSDASATIKLRLILTTTPISGGFSYWTVGEATYPSLSYNSYYGPIDVTVPLNTLVPDGTYYVYMGVFELEGTGVCGSASGYCVDDLSPAFQHQVIVQSGGYSFAPTGAPAATGTAVEYYWPARDHYFFTASPLEIAALDAMVGSWQRTGYQWGVYTAPVAGSVPVCRFYIPPLYGDSHVYTFGAALCAASAAAFPVFTYESPNVTNIMPADMATGACPASTTPLYKLYNQRPDTNHRYTTNTTVRDQMLAKGYVLEGYGNPAVAACAPL
jgi:hypothetical protein